MTSPDLEVVTSSSREAAEFSASAARARTLLTHAGLSNEYARADYYRDRILAPLAEEVEALGLGVFEDNWVVKGEGWGNGYNVPLIEITSVRSNANQYFIDNKGRIYSSGSHSSVLRASSFHQAGYWGRGNEMSTYLDYAEPAITAMEKAVNKKLSKR